MFKETNKVRHLSNKDATIIYNVLIIETLLVLQNLLNLIMLNRRNLLRFIHPMSSKFNFFFSI